LLWGIVIVTGVWFVLFDTGILLIFMTLEVDLALQVLEGQEEVLGSVHPGSRGGSSSVHPG
jgi:hypothetical protein